MPVFHERIAQLGADRSFQLEMNVDDPPRIRVIGQVLLADVHPTGKAYGMIDNQQLPMVS